MDLREAMEAVRSVGITAADLAARVGRSPQSIRQAMLSSDKAGYRPPPEGWREALQEIVRERCADVEALLERIGEGTE